MPLFLILGCLLTTCASPSWAQDRSALAGLAELQLVIENPTDAGLACGLSEATFRTAFSNVVIPTKLRIVNSSTVAFVIGVSTVRAKNGTCSSAGVLKLLTLQNTTLKFSGRSQIATLLLWDDWWVDLSTSPATHSQQVQKSIENSARAFLNEWLMANQ
jgi:hypothetical protein